MVSIAVFLLVISSGSVLGVTVWKRRFTEMLPVSCGLMILLLFMAGLCGHLKTGVLLLLIISGGLFVFSVCRTAAHHEVKGTLTKLMAADTAVFFGLALVFLYCDLWMEVTGWDEFSHWMDTVKSMTLIDDLGTSPEAHTVFPSYPPALSLFEYLLQKIDLMTGGTGFSEWRYIWSYKVISLCMIAPVFRKLNYRSPVALLFAFVSGFTLPGVFYDCFYNSGLVDPFLGVMSGAGFVYLFLYDSEKDRILKRLSVCSAAMMLVLTKDAGLLFAVMLVLGVFASEFLTKNDDSLSSRIRFCLEAVAAVVLPKLAWNLHLKAREVSMAFHEPVVLRDLFQILLQKDGTWRQQSWNQFLHKLVFKKISVGMFDVSFFCWFLVFLGIAALLLAALARNRRDCFPLARNLTLILFLQLVLYVMGLGVEYLFQFGEYAGSIHASFERYIKLAYLGVFIFFQAIALELFTDEMRPPKMETAAALSLCVVLLLTPMATAEAYLSRVTVAESYAFRKDFDQYCMAVDELALKGNGWLITQHYSGAYYKLKSLLKPFLVQTDYFSFCDTLIDASQPEYDVDPEDWMDQLCESYDYVLLYEVDDYFSEHYGYLFEEPEEIGNRTIFSVDKENRVLKIKVKS